MNLPDPQQLLPRMAADLKALLARRGVAQAHFIGIRTGGVWVAEALLRELSQRKPLDPKLAEPAVKKVEDSCRACHEEFRAY